VVLAGACLADARSLLPTNATTPNVDTFNNAAPPIVPIIEAT